MHALANIINIAVTVLIYIVLARCILSFVPHNPANFLISFVYDLSEPVMRPFRKLLPPVGGLDFSPVIAIIALQMAREILIKMLI